MPDSEHVEELIALYVLGGLEKEEAGQVTAHLVNCAACRRLANEALATMALLPYAAPPAAPPPETKLRLMARARVEPLPITVAPRPPGFLGRLALALRALAPAITLLGLVLIIVLVVLDLALLRQIAQLRQENDGLARRLQEEEQRLAQVVDENRSLTERLQQQEQHLALIAGPGIVSRDLQGTELAPQASGRLYFRPGEPTGLLLVYGLSGLAPDETYQLWLIGPDGPQSVSLFRVQPDGRAELPITLPAPVDRYQAVAVSREPANCSPQPTRIVLMGEL